MEPKQSFFPKDTNFYRPQNGSAVNGASHSLKPNGVKADDGKVLKSQIMMRLEELEKQNDRLKNIIEQRKNEISELIAANKEYISVLAHDLKSPFSTIYGVLGLLKDCVHEGNYEEMEAYLDIASSSSINTTNLIENILAWAQMQGTEKRFNPIRVNLAHLVGREIENSNLAVKLKKISLSHTIPENFMVRADLHMSQSIVRNLISNAIKFTNPGGNITISAKEANPFIEIMVKDDGIGISTKDQQRLFNKDTPEEVAGNSNVKGKGLGLMLCREFVVMNGGILWVESQPGKGSSFIFTLPNYE